MCCQMGSQSEQHVQVMQVHPFKMSVLQKSDCFSRIRSQLEHETRANLKPAWVTEKCELKASKYTVHPGGQAQIPLPLQMPPFWHGHRAWHFLLHEVSQLGGEKRWLNVSWLQLTAFSHKRLHLCWYVTQKPAVLIFSSIKKNCRAVLNITQFKINLINL